MPASPTPRAPTYWERFGHDAIELRDTASGEAINFNYGVFDFSEKNFLLNFARGRMHYLMDAAPSDLESGSADEQLVEPGERVVPRSAVGAEVAQPGP